MANLFHTADIVKGSLQRAGEFTDGTSPYHQLAIRYINQVYRSVLSGSSEWGIDLSRPWSWARTTKSLILEPAITAGSVDVTNGSPSGVFTTPPAVSQVGNYLKLDSRPTFYKIISHTGGAGPFTLDANYVEETDTGLPFKSIRLIYDLGSNVMRLVDPFRAYVDDDLNVVTPLQPDEDGKIFGVPLNVLRQEWPLKRIRDGLPNRYAVVSENEDKFEIMFNRFVNKQAKIDADVIEFPIELVDSDSSIPIIPRDFRQVLEYGAAALLLGDKNDDKEQKFLQLTGAALKAMVEDENRQETNINPNKGRMIFRPEQMRRDRVREFF